MRDDQIYRLINDNNKKVFESCVSRKEYIPNVQTLVTLAEQINSVNSMILNRKIILFLIAIVVNPKWATKLINNQINFDRQKRQENKLKEQAQAQAQAARDAAKAIDLEKVNQDIKINNFKEGTTKKGGHNNPPTNPRPSTPPHGQSPVKLEELK